MTAMRFESHPVSVVDIKEVEKRFGIQLPKPLKEFYLQSNGGRPDRDRYKGDGDIYIVNAFLPIKYAAGTGGTLERSIQWLKVDRRVLPDDLVPFAVDPFGNYFCFSISEVGAGAIYFVGMECKGIPNGILLCSSFDEFLANLKRKGEA